MFSLFLGIVARQGASRLPLPDIRLEGALAAFQKAATLADTSRADKPPTPPWISCFADTDKPLPTRTRGAYRQERSSSVGSFGSRPPTDKTNCPSSAADVHIATSPHIDENANAS